MQNSFVPEFIPHPLLWSGHAQTIAAVWLPTRSRVAGRTTRHAVDVSDGDRVVVHEDCPAIWSPGDRVAVLVHGLCGSYASGYMVRIASKLMARGVRTFRMDLRGCGAGRNLASNPYHGGRSDDVGHVLAHVSRLCGASPITAAGFSLGGSLLLRLIGEGSPLVPKQLVKAAAVNAPLDLKRCSLSLKHSAGGRYDRYLARLMFEQVRGTRLWRTDVPLARRGSPPSRVTEFDDLYTAPVTGFRDAFHYYDECSASPYVRQIEIPTLMIASRDDPLVPIGVYEDVDVSPAVNLVLSDRGGHLGYITGRTTDPDRRWMDWRIVEWLTAPLGAAVSAPQLKAVG
ncbi:MAG: YheT family hydrolase [Maioricimonas sp. JB049]